MCLLIMFRLFVPGASEINVLLSTAIVNHWYKWKTTKKKTPSLSFATLLPRHCMLCIITKNNV